MKLINHSIVLIILTFICLSFVACGSSKPNEVGVFLKTQDGWMKLPSYDWDTWHGGYKGTQALSRESLPVASKSTKILINKVPLDPSALYLGRNAGPRSGGNWKTNLDSQPVTALCVNQGVYEISFEDIHEGVYGLVLKGVPSKYRAYFFRIAS